MKNTMSLRRKILYGATVAFVVALLVLPATGWLARLQLMPWMILSLRKIDGGMGNVPVDKSADFSVRYGDALMGGSKQAMPKLDALRGDFPSRPETIAALLRMLTSERSTLYRPEETVISAGRNDAAPKADAKPFVPNPNAARIVALAAEGEVLEPDNGFFPVMAAYAEFALRQDDKAIAAWIRAGEKPRFEDYSLLEVPARWNRLLASTGGREPGAISRMSVSASILLPHFAGIRSAARMASYEAMQAEVGGDAEAGYRIRRATRQIGAAMQDAKGSFIENLVGSAVVAIARYRVGGAFYEKNPHSNVTAEAKNKAWCQAEKQRYADYLHDIGHADEGTAFLQAIANGAAQKEIWRKGSPHTYTGFGDKMIGLMLSWAGNIVLLAGTVFALGFAGIFALVYKFSPRLQRNGILQKSARWGVCMGLLLAAAGVATFFATQANLLSPEFDTNEIVITTAVLLALSPFLLRLSPKEIGHGALVMVATAAAVALVIALIGTVIAVFSGFSTSAQMLNGAMSSSPDDAPQAPAWLLAVPVVFAGVMALLPVLMLALFALFSRMLKIPVAAGVTRGTRSMAVPLACLLLLAWGGCLFNTLRHENAAIAEMKRMAEIGEIRAVAEATGQPFPR